MSIYEFKYILFWIPIIGLIIPLMDKGDILKDLFYKFFNGNASARILGVIGYFGSAIWHALNIALFIIYITSLFTSS